MVAWDYNSAKVSIPQNEAELQKPDLSESLKEFYTKQLKNNKKKLKENDLDNFTAEQIDAMEALCDRRAADIERLYNIFESIAK